MSAPLETNARLLELATAIVNGAGADKRAARELLDMTRGGPIAVLERETCALPDDLWRDIVAFYDGAPNTFNAARQTQARRIAPNLAAWCGVALAAVT